MLRKLQRFDSIFSQDAFIFRGINFRLVAKNPQITVPYVLAIKHDQYMRCLSLWFGGVLGLSIKKHQSQYDSQSVQICCASTASNADISAEL